jgi:hypothetical protein
MDFLLRLLSLDLFFDWLRTNFFKILILLLLPSSRNLDCFTWETSILFENQSFRKSVLLLLNVVSTCFNEIFNCTWSVHRPFSDFQFHFCR